MSIVLDGPVYFNKDDTEHNGAGVNSMRHNGGNGIDHDQEDEEDGDGGYYGEEGENDENMNGINAEHFKSLGNFDLAAPERKYEDPDGTLNDDIFSHKDPIESQRSMPQHLDTVEFAGEIYSRKKTRGREHMMSQDWLVVESCNGDPVDEDREDDF